MIGQSFLIPASLAIFEAAEKSGLGSEQTGQIFCFFAGSAFGVESLVLHTVQNNVPLVFNSPQFGHSIILQPPNIQACVLENVI
jgi:hypothetical protein